MLKSLTKLWKDEEGASAVEYGLVVAGIAAVIIVVVFLIGGKLNNTINNVANKLYSSAHRGGPVGASVSPARSDG